MTRKDDKANNELETAVASFESPAARKDDTDLAANKVTKERVTFQLPVEMIERARDVVYFTPGLTMARLMQEALAASLEKIERKRGSRFTSRGNARLRTGRPIKGSSSN